MKQKRYSGNVHSFMQSSSSSCQSERDESERECEFSIDTDSQKAMLNLPLVKAKQRSGPYTKRQRQGAPRTVTFQESNLIPQTTTEALPKQMSRTNRVQVHDSYSPVAPELSAWTLNDQLYHKQIETLERKLPQRAVVQSPHTLILFQTRMGRENN